MDFDGGDGGVTGPSGQRERRCPQIGGLSRSAEALGAAIMQGVALTGPQALAELLRNYSAQALVEALRLARADLWALFAALFPVSAALAQTMAGVDVGALAAEQRRD